jgi:hypothetical protein
MQIVFNVPPPSDSSFLFRRAFLDAIRTAISKAQIAGEIDAQTAIECFKALPGPIP